MDWVWNLWRANAPLTLAAVLILAGLGVPSPASLAIIATGALVKQGGAPLVPTVLIATTASAVGSFVSYTIGRKGLGRWMEKKKQKPAWAKAVAWFERDAWTTIFLSRWLLTPLGLPVSYLAGSDRYARTKFASACWIGSLIWVLVYGGVGYAFADSWPQAAAKAKQYEFWIGAGVVAIAVVAFLVVRKRKAATPT